MDFVSEHRRVAVLKTNDDISTYASMRDSFIGAIVSTPALAELIDFSDTDISGWQPFVLNHSAKAPFNKSAFSGFNGKDQLAELINEAGKVSSALCGSDIMAVTGAWVMQYPAVTWHQERIAPDYFMALTIDNLPKDLPLPTTDFLATDELDLIQKFQRTNNTGKVKDELICSTPRDSALLLRTAANKNTPFDFIEDALVHASPPCGGRYFVRFVPKI